MARPGDLAVVVNDRRARIAFASLVLGAVSIALAPVFVRISEVGPLATALWRAIIAIPILTGAAILLPPDAGRRKLPNRWALVGGFAAAGIFFAGDLGFWHVAIVHTTVANATLLANMAPIVVTVLSFLLYGTRFTRLFLAGMAVAIAGAAVLMGESLRLDPSLFYGDVLGLITALFYGGYFMAIARLRQVFAAPSVMAGTIAFTALILLPVTLVLEPGTPIPVTVTGWSVVAGVALISQSLGQGLIAYAFAVLPTAFGAVTLLLQPALAALFAWLLFGESLGPVQLLGAGVVLVGILIAREGSLQRGRA